MNEVTPTADERARMADERDRIADARDRRADERDRLAHERDRRFRGLIDAADQRDLAAERRDRSAETRDADDALAQSTIDRIHAGRDRDAAASDRAAFVDRTDQGAATRELSSDDRFDSAVDRLAAEQDR